MPGKSQAALVTAGSKRIGKEICLRLARNGYDIALHYRSSSQEAAETARAIEKAGRRCHVFKADFDCVNELENLMACALEQMPGLSVLVNNASLWQPGRLRDSSLDELRAYMRIHLETPYILTRDFARLAKRGQIINILDSNITKHKSDHFAYLLSKKALHDLTLLSASELAPDIRVNAVAPGAVLPPFDERKSTYESKIARNPLERPGNPDDLLDALEYLLKADHVSGQCIFVCAGKNLL